MKKILVVDDDALVRNLLQKVLVHAGYEILTAENGKLGLERVVASVNMVVLDIGLPDMSGMEVLKKLRETHPQLPVLMLTGENDVQKVVEAIKLGAYDYLTKPFENKRLLLTIQHAIEKNELLS